MEIFGVRPLDVSGTYTNQRLAKTLNSAPDG